MEANTIQKLFIVTRDGEVDKNLSTLAPRRTPVTVLQTGLIHLRQETRLQAKMAVYDVLHGTQYRRIRNQLAAERRNREFEARIGITRT